METMLLVVTALCGVAVLEVTRRSVVGRQLEHAMEQWDAGEPAMVGTEAVGLTGTGDLEGPARAPIALGVVSAATDRGQPAPSWWRHDRAMRRAS